MQMLTIMSKNLKYILATGQVNCVPQLTSKYLRTVSIKMLIISGVIDPFKLWVRYHTLSLFGEQVTW